jgi:3-oxoacyl-ACP reductase-like protein
VEVQVFVDQLREGFSARKAARSASRWPTGFSPRAIMALYANAFARASKTLRSGNLSFKMASLASKVAIVTGSSRGIGRAIAERLADDSASVIVNYNRSADEARGVVVGIEAKRGRAAAIQADCSVVADIRRLFRETISKFGGVDIVVNNAGPEGGCLWRIVDFP